MGSVPRIVNDIGKSLVSAEKTTEYNLKYGIGNKQKQVTTNKKIPVNASGSTSASTKFGEGGSGGSGSPNAPILEPGYGDPYAGYSKPGYTEPGPGGQLDLGRPGDPSNPKLPDIIPWDNQDVGLAPENPSFLPPVPVPYNKQVARLKYRKYAKDRGL